MANPIITGLSSYVEEHATGLIAKSVLGSKSTQLLNLVSDVKGATALNLVSTDVVLQDGSECGWSASGDTKLSQRIIHPKALKVNHNWCDKKLLSTYANYMVKVAAGQKTLPFEEEFYDGVVKGVQEKLENMIYFGSSGNTNEFDGIITILNAESFSYIDKASGTSAYNAIKAAYMAIPERAIKEDTAILVSAGIFRAFIQDLVTANLYHFNPNDKEGEYLLPGTNVKVILVNGLNGGDTNYDYVIAGRLSNLVWGTDAQGDEQKFDAWFSQDNREFRLAIEFVGGTQIAYPDELAVVRIAK